MLTAAELLAIIEEEKTKNVKKLAKEIGISPERLHKILTDLNQHNLVEYDTATGKVTLPKWLLNVTKEIEMEKPSIGEVILPRYKEIQIQDTIIGNYTTRDLELKLRLRAKLKEIAICELT
jgi:predicted transcriptional regulator